MGSQTFDTLTRKQGVGSEGKARDRDLVFAFQPGDTDWGVTATAFAFQCSRPRRAGLDREWDEV